MKNSTKYFGFYRGKVLQCLNNGFCRLCIPDILECMNGDVNTLPIAEAAQTIGGGGDTLNGTYAYPEVGSVVWCFFEGGNVERPVYFAMSNAKSPMWDSVSIPTKKNTNKGNDGVSVRPVGTMIKFNNSAIQQQTIIDEQTDLPIGDKIDITVDATTEQQEMFNQSIANGLSENGISAPFAASIHMDNKRNIISLTAKDTIMLRAPNIIIDSTGFERPGYILVMSDEIDNLTNNGSYKILTSKVNIDSGSNDIIMQTEGNIWQLKTTPAES